MQNQNQNQTEILKDEIISVLSAVPDGIHAVDLFRQVAANTGVEIDPFDACAKLGYDPDDLIALAVKPIVIQLKQLRPT